MMPNIDPRTMKNMMAKMGIKSTEIDATRVIIESNSTDIIIDNPQVTKIEMQGVTSFQITGNISEKEKVVEVSISEEDIKLVQEQTGIENREKVVKALHDANGDIAKAIITLKENNQT
jgi:nascent polypeptide-associated complex subunit alpha